MQQLILDGEVRVPIADPCRPDSDTEALEFLAGALSALRGQPTCRFGCAFELLEQVERGSRNNDHERGVWISSMDLGYCMQQILALCSFVGDQKITSHFSSPPNELPSNQGRDGNMLLIVIAVSREVERC